MLVSYKLLSNYVDLKGLCGEELAKILTDAGLEVEQVSEMTQGSDLVIGQILKVDKHPDSDKLNVCLVETGDNNPVQIVCGADNVRPELKVIVAKVGAKLKYAKVPEIKKVQLAGVESNGMICSLPEIGFQDKFLAEEELDSIYEVSDDLEIGVEALSALNYDDIILDISLTPNRSDIHSIYALALEVSALIDSPVKEVNMKVDAKQETSYQIEIESSDCLSYSLFEFDNISVNPSARNINLELMASGIKARNNVVDAANIAMLVTGNPIHTFDADKLKSKQFIIKKGIVMDDFLALDDNTYSIEEDDLVIVNGEEVVAIAGVIGSKSSAIDKNTKNIVVESAFFDHVSVRNTAKRLDLFTESSIRFSKIVNKYTLDFPIAIFMDLLNLSDVKASRLYELEYQPVEIKLAYSKIKSILGIEISLEECVNILERLGFKVEVNAELLSIYPPMYRKDVEIDVDVIEEIIRVYGIDNIPAKLPVQEITYQPLADIQKLIRNTKDIFVNRGLNEIITYQLNNKNLLDDFSDKKEYKTLANPLSEDRAYFRDQLLSNMVETINYNRSYQHHDLALFEISNVFLDGKEQVNFAIGLTGIFEENMWQAKINKVDFYLLKGLIFEWLDKLGYQFPRYLIEPVEKNHAYFHPTRSAHIKIGKEIVGIFGQIHPSLQKKYKLKDTYLASINLTKLNDNKPKVNKYEPLNLLPSVNRDLSLVVKDDIDVAQIIKVIKVGNKLIKDIKIFDVYKGENIEEGYYSLSLSLIIKDDKQTLNEEAINEVVNKVLKNLQDKLAINLRS